VCGCGCVCVCVCVCLSMCVCVSVSVSVCFLHTHTHTHTHKLSLSHMIKCETQMSEDELLLRLLQTATDQQQEDLPQQFECVICMERARSRMLRPCGHLCVCEVCWQGLKACPLSRSHPPPPPPPPLYTHTRPLVLSIVQVYPSLFPGLPAAHLPWCASYASRPCARRASCGKRKHK
jgi:hypothetical protein